jgi:hypothetical protein
MSSKSETCAVHGHNYFQLNGKEGVLPILACSKCGATITVKPKKD